VQTQSCRLALAASLVAVLIATFPQAAQADRPHRVTSDIETTLPLVGFNMMIPDQAHHHVFVTGTPASNSSIAVVDYKGTIIKSITGLAGASGMALDTKRHTLYVALNTADAIAAIDTNTLTETTRWNLGAGAQCPESLTMVRKYVYFGLSYSCSAGGIGVLDPTTGFVTVFSGSYFPFYAPLLDSSPGAPGILIASDRGLSPAELYEYVVKPNGSVSFVQSLWSPCGSSNLGDLDIMPNGADVLTASGAPYNICAFRVSGLTADGTYPTGPYPNGAEVSPDSVYLAAGINGIYSPDLFLFQIGDTTVLASYDFAVISPAAPDLFARGEGWGMGPGGTKLLFAVTNDSYLGTPPVFHIIQSPV
jgi:hypothetical protein